MEEDKAREAARRAKGSAVRYPLPIEEGGKGERDRWREKHNMGQVYAYKLDPPPNPSAALLSGGQGMDRGSKKKKKSKNLKKKKDKKKDKKKKSKKKEK